jgi:hypothetical protein
VAYRGWDGHDWEIYVYSNGIVPVTQNEVDEGWFLSFSRYGQGQVVGESKTAGGTTEIILGNPTYFFYDTCTLRDGAVYTGFVLAKIDFTYYIGFLSGEATPSYQGFYLPYDWGTEGDDWTAYYFSYTIGGQTYIGLGKDYETGTDWGYCYGFNQATPADYFICAYQETAPSTYQYYYSYADGAMYLGQAYVNLPSGYYFGVLNGGSKYYLGVYYFLEGLTNGPGSGKGIFWSLVHGVNLLDHEYGD